MSQLSLGVLGECLMLLGSLVSFSLIMIKEFDEYFDIVLQKCMNETTNIFFSQSIIILYSTKGSFAEWYGFGIRAQIMGVFY